MPCSHVNNEGEEEEEECPCPFSLERVFEMNPEVEGKHVCGECAHPAIEHKSPPEKKTAAMILAESWNPFTVAAALSSMNKREPPPDVARAKFPDVVEVVDLTKEPETPPSVDLTGEPDESDETSKTCAICAERENTHAFIPCGHKAVCFLCASLFTECPVCNAPVEKTIKIFDVSWN